MQCDIDVINYTVADDGCKLFVYSIAQSAATQGTIDSRSKRRKETHDRERQSRTAERRADELLRAGESNLKLSAMNADKTQRDRQTDRETKTTTAQHRPDQTRPDWNTEIPPLAYDYLNEKKHTC